MIDWTTDRHVIGLNLEKMPIYHSRIHTMTAHLSGEFTKLNQNIMIEMEFADDPTAEVDDSPEPPNALLTFFHHDYVMVLLGSQVNFFI